MRPKAPGMPMPAWARCMCARSSTCGATVRCACARSPRKRQRWCASTRAPIPASTVTACAGANGWPGSTARASTPPLARSRRCSIRTIASTRTRSYGRRRWTPARTSALRRAMLPCRSRPHSTGPRGTSAAIRSPARKRRPARAPTAPAASPLRWRCATTTAIAASSTRAPCARAIA
ncbi:hypothetical protein D3C72_1723560 [compost metagenome]